MILFLYGEDTYSSAEKLRSIKQRYIDASLGDTNLFTQDVSEEKLDFKRFQQIVSTQPFLAKKRLVIFKNLLEKGPKKLQEQISESLNQIPASTVVLFYEQGVPDRRLKFFRILNKPKISQEFKKMTPQELNIWIKKRIEVVATKEIDKEYLTKILTKGGNDLWRVSSNIEKIVLYLDNQNGVLNKDEIAMLVSEKTESGIFDFIDVLANKDTQASYRMFHNLLKQGENGIYIFTMIVYQFRNLLIVKDIIERENKNINQYQLSRVISQKARINPYVVGRLINISKKYSILQLQKIYKLLFDVDIGIKTGKIEVVLALDILIGKICK